MTKYQRCNFIICDHLKNSNLSADNFKEILDLDGSAPEPAVLSSDTGQRIPYFDSCQLITTLMSNMCALSVFLRSRTRESMRLNIDRDLEKTINPRYGHVILASGYPVLTAVN